MSVATATAELRQIDSGHFAVVGEIGFDTVRGVTKGDSAGLALLIEWLKQAARSGKTVRFTHVPGQLRALAQISEIEGFLPLSA